MTNRYIIPRQGKTQEEISATIDEYCADDQDPVLGLAAGSPFATGREDLEEVAQQAFLRFWDANAMYRCYFPSIERMEQELVGMTASLLNAPDAYGGTVTSGGSESILLAVKAARDAVRSNSSESADLLVLSQTAHPAFWKAAEFLGLRVREVLIDETFHIDLRDFERALGRDVVLAVASAPSFVLGTIDPIEEMAALCVEKGVALHVDGCVGGFALPWLETLGFSLAPFDFRVEGVVSISADLHKYGYAPRGISTVVTRQAEWADHAVFRYGSTPRPDSWYVTPTVAGSRPAGSVAAAWAVMNHLGQDGYLTLARETRDVCERFWETLEALDLELLGNPAWSLFTFSMHPETDLTADLAAGLRQQGWLVHEDVFPQPLIRMMMAPGQFSRLDSYVKDLAAIVKEVRAGRRFTDSADAAYT